MMPAVSVIISTRNRCALLPRAVESARRAGTNVEIIIVDDASQDQTREVCRSWPDVLYLATRRRVGLGGARNLGLIASTSPYISFLDDDDIRLPDSLNAQVELLESNLDAGMIYGRALYGDEECRPKGDFYPHQSPQGDVFWELLRWNFIPCPTVVFRRECLMRVGLLEEEAPGVEDWDLWVRIAELYPVLAKEDAVAIWRQASPSSGQFTSRAERLHRAARRLHRNKWLYLPRAVAAGYARRRTAARALAECASQQLIWTAAASFKSNRLTDCVRYGLAAVRLHPVGVPGKVVRAIRGTHQPTNA